jgi:CTP:molybdopterin cytidylyltransferase MocA
LAAVPADAAGVMFMLVDTPAVLPSTIAKIAKRFEERTSKQRIVVPRVEGRHGHPVCVSGEIAQELLGLPYQAQARDVIHAHVAETVYVDVDDKGVVDDVNDSGGYEHLKARLGTTA